MSRLERGCGRPNWLAADSFAATGTDVQVLYGEEVRLTRKKVNSGYNAGMNWHWHGGCGNVEASVCDRLIEAAE